MKQELYLEIQNFNVGVLTSHTYKMEVVRIIVLSIYIKRNNIYIKII